MSSECTNGLLHLSFNQDFGCFAVGTTDGFTIYNVDPFRETFRRPFINGIGIVEMLFRCNLLAFVGSYENATYPPNKVMIWDDHQNKCIGELTFKVDVLSVKLRRDRIVVVLNSRVFVYRFSDLKLIDQISTIPNPKGLISLCADVSNNVLAVPGLARGSIRIELYDIAKATIIKAHDAELAQFTLSSDGSRIASASEKGTLIRLWDCHSGDLLREFRRGTDRADINCITFNHLTTYLACTSDKGTIHIFSLIDSNMSQPNKNKLNINSSNETTSINMVSTNTNNINTPRDQHNRTSSSSSSSVAKTDETLTDSNTNKGFGLNFLRGIIPTNLIPKYINSEWSFAQIRGIESKCICAFDRDSQRIIVLSYDGTYLLCSFEEGGECPRIATAKFMRNEETDDEHTS